MNRLDKRAHRDFPGFDVDGMLGRLAKWLRILGFDAVFPRAAPSEGRVFVTTKKGAPSPCVIRILGGTITEQLREVLDHVGIVPHPDLIFSRCLLCNAAVEKVTRESVEGKVPGRVFGVTCAFHQCPQCGRVYWEGTHEARVRKSLERMGIFTRTNSQL